MRKVFRPIFFAAATAATLFRFECSAATTPNILFIMADDHAWQAVSAYGDARRRIQTPNIDRLANEGVRFDRCLVPNSLCGQTARQRKELKEPKQDDPKSFGYPA